MLLQGHQCLTRRLTDCSSKTLQNCVLMFVCYSVGSRVWAVLELSRALQLQIFFGVLKVDAISLPFHPNGGGRGGGGGEG